MSIIRRRTLVRVFLRSLWLQSAWNAEGMQNLGVAFALWPALQDLYDDDELRQEALARHLGVFNTHPYMAAVVLGAVVNMEQGLAQGTVQSEQQIRSFKVGVMGSYGAIGDGLFWAGLKPLSLVLAGVVSLFTSPWTAVVVFLLVYNLGHLTLRLGGFVSGVRLGLPVLMKVRDLNLPRWTARVRLWAYALAGIFIVAGVLSSPPLPTMGQNVAAAGGVMALAFVLSRIFRRGLSGGVLLVAVFLIASIIGSIFVAWGAT